jgi:hypothetical protein
VATLPLNTVLILGSSECCSVSPKKSKGGTLGS